MCTSPSPKHRILLYTTNYNVLDGVTLTIRKIEQEILNAGHSVCILTSPSGDMKNTHLLDNGEISPEHPNRSVLFLDKKDVIPLEFANDPKHPESHMHLGVFLSSSTKHQISKFGPTLIHITVPDPLGIQVVQFARQMEIPLMGTYHTNFPEGTDHYPGFGWLKHIVAPIIRHQYNFFQALFVPTPYMHNYLKQTYRMDQITNLQTWGRGVDLSQFRPEHRSQDFRTRMGFQTDHVVICWVGRLVPEKRPDIFAYVIRKLHQNGVPFRALVIGQGLCEEEMKALPNTVCAGWLSGQALAEAYASSDVFLFPSAAETFGNVALEAAASGLPVVVEKEDLGHVVQHGKTGFACGAEDLDAWYENTLRLVQDGDLRKKMSLEGREFSHQFEKQKVCRQMIDNYTMVTKEFHTEYSGRHANRDAAFRNEHSFVAGNHPRPLSYTLIEFCFLHIFCQIVFKLARLVFYILEVLDPVLQRVRGSPVLSTSDNTETKVYDTCQSSKDSKEIQPRHVAPNEFHIAHLLAKAFLQTIFFIFRWESWLRNEAYDLYATSHWLPIEYKKKKVY